MPPCRRLSLPNFFLIFLFFKSIDAKEWISALPIELYVPQNLQLGDEIVGEEAFRTRGDADEIAAISLSPSSDAVSIAPDAVKPGEVFRFILKDRDSLLSDFTLQLLGVYSGNLQEVPLRFILDNERNGNVSLRFEKEIYDLKLSTPLLEKEIALIKMTDVVPSWSRFNLDGPLSDHFSAYSDGGVLIIASIPCKHCIIDIPKQFSLFLTYFGAEKQRAVLNFNVENTHRIRFENSYEAEIEEGASTFKRLVKLRATGGHATYSLDDPSGLFSVHPKTGMLTVQHPEFVFIDTIGEQITINATATDGEQRTKTAIKIKILSKTDVKDFAFEKDAYKLTISAGQHMANELLKLSSNIKDVRYRLSEGPQDLFQITGGNLFYTGSYPKNDERYNILVLAETADTTIASVTKVDVLVKGIGSNVLKLVSRGRITVTASSDEPIGKLLQVMEVSDSDSDAQILFSIEKVTAHDYDGNIVEVPKEAIEVIPHGLTADIKLKSEIGDNEWYALEVVVEAKDSAHLLEKPVYSHTELIITRKETIKREEQPLKIMKAPPLFALPSSIPEGSFVYQVRTFPSSNVTFSLENQSDNFNVDELTGIISTNRPLFPSPAKEILLISARRGNQKIAQNFTIDVIDFMEKVPKLMQEMIMVEVPVTAEVGTPIANITVVNSIPVSFASLEGSDLFIIDSKGIIVTSSPLPHDVRDYILLARVKGSDGEALATIHVTVDLDAGNSLRFSEESYQWKIMQNILVNSYVGTVKLASRGLLPVKFSINAAENEEQMLDIDDEGRITLREEFDTITAPRKYTVTASDGKRTTSSTVEITVLPAFDCVPEFIKGENDIFYVNENELPGMIGKVQAKELEKKCEMSYFFWDGERMVQETSYARIDPSIGEIFTKKIFDYENTTTYPLILGLRAGMRQTAEMGAILMVKDQDDHPLEFKEKKKTVEISESSPINTLITTVMAEDPDVSQKIYYLLKQEGDEFTIGEENGEIRLAKQLDREKEDRYRIKIGAANNQNPIEGDISIWMTVNIVVRDVNDNGPAFEHGHYEALLEKMALPGRKVAKVHAIDPDQTETGAPPMAFYSLVDTQFEYRGTSRPMRGFFHVEQKTGEVMLLEPVNEFVGGVFHLQIQAADGLSFSSKKSLTSLRVIIHEDSDVILTEIPKNPESVDIEDVTSLTETISNATGHRVLVKDISYHSSEGIVLNKITNLRLVLVNKTTFEIASADKTMAMMKSSNKQAVEMPKIERAQLPVIIEESFTFPMPLLIIGTVFLLLFILASVILALMLCHYRARYNREKENFEGHRIIRNSLEEPARRYSPPSPPRLPTAEEDDRMGYMSQERKLSVGPDEMKPR